MLIAIVCDLNGKFWCGCYSVTFLCSLLKQIPKFFWLKNFYNFLAHVLLRECESIKKLFQLNVFIERLFDSHCIQCKIPMLMGLNIRMLNFLLFCQSFLFHCLKAIWLFYCTKCWSWVIWQIPLQLKVKQRLT